MLFANDDEIIQYLKGIVSLNNGGIVIENIDRLKTHGIDTLVENSVLNPSGQIRGLSRFIIKSHFQLSHRATCWSPCIPDLQEYQEKTMKHPSYYSASPPKPLRNGLS